MRQCKQMLSVILFLIFWASGFLYAKDFVSAIQVPVAGKILHKDALGMPKVYKIPANCISNDPSDIKRGSFLFHHLNGAKIKGKLPKGVAKYLFKNGKKVAKQYGNCVACHNIEGAKGAGSIGPDLHDYKKHFIDSGIRNYQYVYQQIADPRIHNPNTDMTINLTTGLFTPREICDIASYVVSEK